MVVRVELREKYTNSTCHGCRVSHSDLFNAVSQIYSLIVEQVGPQLNRHTRYRPATTTRNTATQRSRRSMD